MNDIYNNGDGSYKYNNKTYYNINDAERDRQNDIYREYDARQKSKKKGKDEKIGCLPTIFIIGIIPVLIAFGWKGVLIFFWNNAVLNGIFS